MSLPTIEVVQCPATESARNNPRSFQPAASILNKQDGVLKVFQGVQHEDQKTAYALIAWESLEHHLRLRENAEVFSELRGPFAEVFDTSAPPEIFHVKPTSDPYIAFGAPVLELATFTLIDGKFDEKSKAVFEEFFKQIDDLFGGKSGFIGTSWGPTVEKENVVVGFIGWDSVQAHTDSIHAEPERATKVIAIIKDIATVNVVHIPLNAF